MRDKCTQNFLWNLKRKGEI